MRTTTSESTRSLPLVTSRMATPPPSPMLDLHDADEAVGWIDGRSIGFRGFGNETEAIHAAWVAYRTMARRFARQDGSRAIPIDTEPMALSRSGDVELILAGGRPIATLVRPGAESRSGPQSFGFELQLPAPADELTTRSTAYLVYRTLRRSGVRWAIWTPARRVSPAPDEARADERGPATVRPTRTPSRRGADAAAAAMRRDDSPVILGTVSIVLAMLVLVILPAITTSTVVHLLGGAAALIALVALASLVHLVVTEVRESPRRRSGPTRPARPGGRRSRMAAWLTRGRDVARGRARTLFARFHERFAGRTWRRSLLGTLAALTGASLALALVVRSPQSVPLLVGVGLTAILALRLLAAPSRGITRTAAVAAPLSVTLAVAVGRSDTPEPRRADASSAPATVRSRAAITPETRPAARGGASAAGMRADAGRVDHARDGGWLDWSTDEVHAAALDSFPASDPPSWSPLRVGAPTVTVPNMSAQA